MASATGWVTRPFLLSCDVDLDVKVFVGSLALRAAALPGGGGAAGPAASAVADALLCETYVSLQIVDGRLPLHAFPRCTGLSSVSSCAPGGEDEGAGGNGAGAGTGAPRRPLVHAWNEWLTLPVKVRDLPERATLLVRVHGVGHAVLGGGSFRVFDAALTLRAGACPLVVWRAGLDAPALDAAAAAAAAAGAGADGGGAGDSPLALLMRPARGAALVRFLERFAGDRAREREVRSELSRAGRPDLAAHVTVANVDAPASPWTDRLLAAALQRELLAERDADAEELAGGAGAGAGAGAGGGARLADALTLGALVLHLPRLPAPVLFEDAVYASPGVGEGGTGAGPSSGLVPEEASLGGDALAARMPPLVLQTTPAGAAVLAGGGEGGAGADAAGRAYWGENLLAVWDPEDGAALDNPSDVKYHKIVRAGTHGAGASAIKPTRAELAKIQAVVGAPDPTGAGAKPPQEAADLLWRLRYSLTGNKRALVKFAQIVDWNDEAEADEAGRLLGGWTAIDTEDALRLLCPEFSSPVPRAHAVAALRRAGDEELLLYLLQLVQALRYEPALPAAAAAFAVARAAAGGAADAGGGGAAAAAPGGAGASGASAGAVGAGAGASAGAGAPAGGAAAAGASAGGASAGAGASAVAAAAASAAAAGGAGAGERGGGGGGGGGASDAAAAGAAAAAEVLAASPLAAFLAERAAGSQAVALSLHWYLVVAEDDPSRESAELFRAVRAAFDAALRGSGRAGAAIADVRDAQVALLGALARARDEATSSKKDGVKAKIEKLNAILSDGGPFPDVVAMPRPLPLPCSPAIPVCGVVPGGCHMFKSALYPTVVTFKVHPTASVDWASDAAGAGVCGLTVSPAAKRAAAALRLSGGCGGGGSGGGGGAAGAAGASALGGGASSAPGAGGGGASASAVADAVAAAAAAADAPAATYSIMFKQGDDMRQDALIIQLLKICDDKLRRVGLDLHLTPYAVVATGRDVGHMELVLGSLPVSAILENAAYARSPAGPVQAYLKEKNPDVGADYGIAPGAMDTYVKSCAGYAAITYLLGIGDRHLDNILIATDGRLFHVDFGFIFGRDPKPLPAAIRITREMVDGMGGPASANYSRFRALTCQAYNVLRRHAGLVTVLLTLMRDAGIPDLGAGAEAAAVIAKLHDKFRVDLTDEAADDAMLQLIDDSVSALAPQFFEVLHKIRVAFR